MFENGVNENFGELCAAVHHHQQNDEEATKIMKLEHDNEALLKLKSLASTLLESISKQVKTNLFIESFGHFYNTNDFILDGLFQLKIWRVSQLKILKFKLQ